MSIVVSVEFDDVEDDAKAWGFDDGDREVTADRVLASLLEAGGGSLSVSTMRDFGLLDHARVHIRVTPQIPEELRVQTCWAVGEEPPVQDSEWRRKVRAMQRWVNENTTTATWEGFA